jgi:hypothetical protein
MCDKDTRFVVRTIFGVYMVCEDCAKAHPLPAEYRKGNYQAHPLSDTTGCQCEHASHE